MKMTKRDAGAVLVCVYSSFSYFRIGKRYTTYSEKGTDCPMIEDFVLNGYEGHDLHTVVGVEGVIAAFRLVKRKGGKYIKSTKYVISRTHDNRRARRAMRNAAKQSNNRELLKLARNHK